MTAAQQQAMRSGRERALAAHRERQAERVRLYLRWLRDGAKPGELREVPTDADFRAYRRVMANRTEAT